ncbi:uncharacterized protein [Periplaneta americana]|uniref:uncharacterized protein n=1 Tax=Periplaneta americana TaxID=6978 RepID=UPI0037E735D9
MAILIRLFLESKFVTILNGPLKAAIGLNEQEIAELADYFRVQDGRILYNQFCEVVHDSVPKFANNAPLVTGLEWEDPFHVNSLSVLEERRLHLLLSKIASLVNLRKLILRPYFQDYELISKNNGTVTIDHFARVLNYLGIMVSAEDFNLLIKKFVKDSYTLNYVAFVAYLDQIIKYMDRKQLLDLGGDVLLQWPGRAISAELPKLPRPEIGKIRAASIFGLQSIFHPALEPPVQCEDLERLIRRIQQHIYYNRIRTTEFFKQFDSMNCGRVTVAQFRRGLDMMGLAGVHRLWLSEPEILMLICLYRDPNDPSRVCYCTFQDDLDQERVIYHFRMCIVFAVFTVKGLQKAPCLQVVAPPPEITEIPRKGAEMWGEVKTNLRDLCEETLAKIKQKATIRSIDLRPAFNDYDRHNNGHVSRSEFRQVLSSNGILCSAEEMYALEQRYNDDMGFNYFWFIKEAESKKLEEPLFNEYVQRIKRLNEEPPKRTPQSKETNIVEILAKIKGKVVRERIRVIEFMRDFDRHNQCVISRDEFWRGLDACRFNLSPAEVETLMEVFASPFRRECVDYQRFCETVEEAVTQASLERAPLITPLQHLPSNDCDRNFLNFEERHTVSMALEKIAGKHNLNLMYLFQNYDRVNCGTVTRDQFTKVLAVRGLTSVISSHELEVLQKCFGFERGLRDEVDYRAFCRCLELLYTTSYRRPC